MKKTNCLRLGVLLFSSIALLASCGAKDNSKKYTVTFYDGETVLKEEKVKENEKAARFEPTKENYDFVNWYATPSYNHLFDFDTEIKKDTSIYAGFSQFKEDTREFNIVGSGRSPLLSVSNWGKVIQDEHKLQKTAGKNEYKITLDLYEDDAFQFALNTSWYHQRGVGYFTTTYSNELKKDVFEGGGGLGDASAKRSNAIVKVAGNYTFTLVTHPNEDYYDGNYTEENKECFNLNPFDSISWVRNGDVQVVQEVMTNYYIKGAGITEWEDVYTPATSLVKDGHQHQLTVFLRENEEFLFTSLNTIDGNVTTGTEYLRYTNLDEESQKLFSNNKGNLITLKEGNYTFNYNDESKVMNVSFEEATLVPTDYYIDGTFGEKEWDGYCFNKNYQMNPSSDNLDLYEIKNVKLKKDSQIVVQAFKAGATERGTWGTDSYNGLACYNYNYLVDGGENFSKVDATNSNVKVLVEGTYNISFNHYTKVMTITLTNA